MKKYRLEKTIRGLAIFIAFMAVYARASAQKIDSIRNVLARSLPDTTQVNLLAGLAHCYRDVNVDSMIAIAGRGVTLAESIQYDNGKARCLKELGTGYSARNDYEKTFTYYNEALSLFKKANNLEGQSQTMISIANVYGRQLKNSLSLDYYKKSLEISQQINDVDDAADALIKIGVIYSDVSNYSEALRYYLEALRMYEEEKNDKGILLSLTNLATVYSQLGDNKKAMDYISQCLAMPQNGRDKHNLISFYVDIGTVYSAMKDYQHTLFYFNKALGIADSIADKYWRGICLFNIAETHYNMGNYDDALKRYWECLSDTTDIQDNSVIAFAHLGIGNILGKEGKPREALNHIQPAFDMIFASGLKDDIFQAAISLSNTYEQLNDNTHALKYYKVAYNYRDSVLSEKNDKRIQQLQFDYQLEKEKKQVLSEKNRTHQQRIIIWGMSAGVVLLLVLIVALFRSGQKEKRNRQMISLQRDEIQHQAMRLEELNAFKDKTFSVLSHDMRGPLNAFISTMELLEEDAISKEEFNALKPELNNELNSLSMLLDNLLKWSKSHMKGNAGIDRAELDLRAIAQENIALAGNISRKKEIAIHNHIPRDIRAFADKGQVNIVIRNLINNALKFTGANGSVILSATEDKDHVYISIADTGVGMTEEQQKKLFIVAPEKSTYGTGGEKGIGLGLLLCYEFIKANNGDITVTSEPGKGSTFVVTLPKNSLPS